MADAIISDIMTDPEVSHRTAEAARGTGAAVIDKRLAARQLAWARKQWRRSERGSWFVNARGFNIVVFASRKGYGIRIEQRYGCSRRQFGKQRFATAAEAMERAFDALQWAAKRCGNGRYSLTNDGSTTTP